MSSAAPYARSPALRAIIVYKFVRGAFALFAGLVLGLLIWHGGVASLHAIAAHLRDQWTSGVSGHVAAFALELLEGRHIWLAVIGLELDGSLTLLEGFALQRGYRWGAWLVVVLASVLVPFELTSWAHQPSLGRALLLLGNLLVAAYLALRVLHERAA